jgi:hypothetical protein
VDKDQILTLSRSRKLCANCNAPIDAIERHPSVIKEGKRQLERFDYCPACWEHIKDEVFDSFWLARRERRQSQAPKLSRRERRVALRALFESLRERREDEDVAPHLFLISHLLLKWGGLRWRENRMDEDGREVIVFEDPTTGEHHEVPTVPVDDENLLRIKGEIEEFLRQYAPEDQTDPIDL